MESTTKAIVSAKIPRHATFVNIPDSKYTIFKKKALKKFGVEKGAVKKAMEEAMNLWMKEN
jgi:hypothetical protein